MGGLRNGLLTILKEGWALRTETTFNDPTDVQPTKALATLSNLRQVGQQINARLLETERLGNDAMPQPSLVDQVQRPRFVHGQRIAALRLSDPRVLALLRPCARWHRAQVASAIVISARLWPRSSAVIWTATPLGYDVCLRRLRLHGLIQRVPHSFRYILTADGLHLAFGLSRIVLRLLQPGWTDLLRSDLHLPIALRDALIRLNRPLEAPCPTRRSPLRSTCPSRLRHDSRVKPRARRAR